MGRVNYFWSSVVTIIVYTVIAFQVPGLEQSPPLVATIILLLIISFPIQLLVLRRIKAAKIPLVFWAISWLSVPWNLFIDGGDIETLLNLYQFGFVVWSLFAPNKVEVLTP